MADPTPAGSDDLRQFLLVLRCQAGDEGAFARLYQEYSQRTQRYLIGLVDDDADDVQQEVWLAVYRGLRHLSNPRAFRTWLFQTTRHRAIDFLRRRRREHALLAAAAEAQLGADDGEPAPEPVWDAERLATDMAALPPALREVLVLRYQNDLSYADIALVTGCSVGTVRSRLHHAKRRLAELIKGAEHADQD